MNTVPQVRSGKWRMNLRKVPWEAGTNLPLKVPLEKRSYSEVNVKGYLISKKFVKWPVTGKKEAWNELIELVEHQGGLRLGEKIQRVLELGHSS